MTSFIVCNCFFWGGRGGVALEGGRKGGKGNHFRMQQEQGLLGHNHALRSRREGTASNVKNRREFRPPFAIPFDPRHAASHHTTTVNINLNNNLPVTLPIQIFSKLGQVVSTAPGSLRSSLVRPLQKKLRRTVIAHV